MRSLFSISMTALVLVACGGDETTGTTTDGTTTAATDATIFVPDSGQTDSGATGATETVDTSEPDTAPPQPGEFGYACDENIEFKIASRSEIQTLLRTFVEKIVPMLSADPDLKVDRLAEIDALQSRMPGDSDSLVGAWERLLSGGDQIALDTSRGAQRPYSINSGRHRILAARDIGMTHIPALVSRSQTRSGNRN